MIATSAHHGRAQQQSRTHPRARISPLDAIIADLLCISRNTCIAQPPSSVAHGALRRRVWRAVDQLIGEEILQMARHSFMWFAVLGVFTFATAGQAAADDASYAMTIGGSSFQPGSLSVKAGTKIKLVVTNASSKTVEFESSDLNREKVIAAGSSTVVYIGPLEPGSYGVFDDFNPSVKGQIVAK
jgi:plastocyanin